MANLGNCLTINGLNGHFLIIEGANIDIATTGTGEATTPVVITIAASGVVGLGGGGTDEHIMRWDGTSGAQDSRWQINDAGDMLGENATGDQFLMSFSTFEFVVSDFVSGDSAGHGLGHVTYNKNGVGVGDLNLTGITASRTWTAPDGSGTILLDTTAYSDFPPFSDRFRLHGSNDTDGASGEVDLDVTLTMTGSTLKVADNSIGPTQIDQAAAYTWSGDSEFSGNNLFSNSNTFQGDDAHSGAAAFTNTATGVKFSAKCVLPYRLPNSTSDFNSAGTGTITLSGLSIVNGYVEVQYVTVGAGTADVFLPIDLMHTLFGRRLTAELLKWTMSKPTSSAGTTQITEIAIAKCVGTSNATTRTFSDVIASTGLTILNGAPSAATVVTTSSNFTDTQLTVDGMFYLRIRFSHSVAATTTWRLFGNSDHTQLQFSTAQ